MNLSWKDHDLYAGQVYIGTVTRVVPEGWRAWDTSMGWVWHPTRYCQPKPQGSDEREC